MSKVYNVPTNLSEQYPFGIDESSLSKEWSYHPLVKQKKNFPTWVITSEADTLDEPPYANLFIDDSSNDYDYSINQIDTKEIRKSGVIIVENVALITNIRGENGR